MRKLKRREQKEKPEETNIKDLFSTGCLIHLNVGIWGAKAKVKDDIYEEEVKKDKDILRTTQDLLGSEGQKLLKEIQAIYHETYNYVKSNSLPCPIRSLQFIPKDKIVEIDEYLQGQKDKFTEKVKEFIENYASFQEAFKKKTNKKLYRPEKYPTVERLKGTFYFYWSFRILSVPEKSGMLSPSIYKREVEKAKGEIQEIVNMTMDVVKTEFIKKINRLKEFTSDGKIPKKTVNSVGRLLEKYDELWSGFIGQNELKEVVENIRKEMGKIDTDNEDSSYVKKVTKTLGKITESLDDLPDFQSQRALDY